MLSYPGAERRFRRIWSERLGPVGVEEALRSRRIALRARPVMILGGLLLAVGVGLSNIYVLCVAGVLLIGGFYMLLWPSARAQHRAQEAASEFQRIDPSLAFMLTMSSPKKFDSQCNLARRMPPLRDSHS